MRQQSSSLGRADSTSTSAKVPNGLDMVCDAAIAAVRGDSPENTGMSAHSLLGAGTHNDFNWGFMPAGC